MIKPEVYDIASTNIANLGSDLERDIKKASAEGEPAWDGAGAAVGLRIWRIEQFHVIDWPLEQYGSFYKGDSYIILNTYQVDDSEALNYDVHFWLGTDTTQDEAGTAAYKTVELDTLLDDKPVQYREVDGFESPLFLSYFPEGIVTMEGGAESGFNHVEPESYEPRLLHIKGKFNNIVTKQVPLEIASLNSGDVFVLDAGLKIFVFQGASAGLFEKRKGGELVASIREGRAGSETWTVYENDDSDPEFDAEFWGYFGGKQEIASAQEAGDDAAVESAKKLFRLSDESGEVEFTLVGEGDLDRTMLDTNDVFVLDTQFVIIVWVGAGASDDEKRYGMRYAQEYVDRTYESLPLSISLVQEGGCTNETYRRMFE